MHSDAGVSRHKCLIYDGDPSEQLPVVVPLLMDGLKERWRCLYLGSPNSVRMVDTALLGRGIDTAREATRGALVFSSDRSHLAKGAFEPRAMVDGLHASIDAALLDGYEGLCATGDMRWELGADENFDRLLEYEALLEQVIRERPLRGICQYHRDILPARAVRDALLTHKATFVGDELNRDNLFYIPPELVLQSGNGIGAGAGKEGEWMCQQILRVLKAERARDDLLATLEQHVAERTAELQVANRHLEAFSYSVAHDLRAPLRAVSGFATALAEDCGESLGADGHAHLQRILGGARHMGDLIDGLLELARVVKADLRRQTIDLTSLAGVVLQELRAAEPARRVDVIAAPGLHAVGDQALVRAVLTNLLGNAWKYSAKRREARIELGQEGNEAGMPVFFVKDNGAGFDMTRAAKLFGVFQRLHRADEFPGHGVGLAVVERIVSRHGGRIWAESRPDAGATFFFTLPGAA
jgi:signal transduction histidine kinase